MVPQCPSAPFAEARPVATDAGEHADRDAEMRKSRSEKLPVTSKRYGQRAAQSLRMGTNHDRFGIIWNGHRLA
jgi:hypothetical protein